MSAYHNSNLLYRPSVSIWTARKKDKAESAKVNESNGAVDGAANVHKQLLPDSPELEAVRKWADSFRGFIYLSTLPWDDSGWRIGRVVRHMDFMAAAGDKMRIGEALFDAFVDKYAQGVENAKFTLNHMFNLGDYPTAVEVRSKFRVTLEVSTLPNSDDFRVVDGVPPEEVEKLVGIAKTGVEARIQAAMDEAYLRLFQVVSKMASTLDAYGSKEIKKFNDTLVENIVDLVEVMPALNITGDPKLAALAAQARDLAQYAPVDLRKDEGTRKAAIKEARALAALLSPVGAAETTVTPPSAPVGANVFADMMEV